MTLERTLRMAKRVLYQCLAFTCHTTTHQSARCCRSNAQLRNGRAHGNKGKSAFSSIRIYRRTIKILHYALRVKVRILQQPAYGVGQQILARHTEVLLASTEWWWATVGCELTTLVPAWPMLAVKMFTVSPSGVNTCTWHAPSHCIPLSSSTIPRRLGVTPRYSNRAPAYLERN